MRRVRSALFIVAVLLLPVCRRDPGPSRLVVAYPSGPITLLPHASTNEEFTTSIFGNVFETLVGLDENLGLRPGLAESWHNPDDLTWVFRLRRGARLHDGRLLEGRHVVESLERARSDPESTCQAELTAVAGIEAPDPDTVVIKTRFPFAPLPNRLTNVPIWAKALSGGPPVGTGPYRIHTWTIHGDTVLEAFDQHHGGAPSLRIVEFKVVPDTLERLRLLREGKVNLIVDVPPEQIAALQAEPTLRTVARQGLRVMFLAMDCARSKSSYLSIPENPFRDARVRRAVALAIDRGALVKGPLGGHATVVDQVIAPEVFGYHASLPERPFDPAEARRLLREAGHGNGFDVDLDFMPGKYQAIEAIVAHVAANLAELRIRIRPRPYPPSVFLDRIERRDTAFYILGWISNSGDAELTYEYLLHTPGGGFGLENGGGYSSPPVDRFLELAAGRLRPEERRPFLRQVAETILTDAPVIPLYRQTDLYALSKDVEFTPRLDRRIRAARIRWRTGS